MTKLMPTRRTLSKKDKLNIIFASYGSLTNFKCKIRRPAVVGRLLGFCRETIWTLLRRLRRNKFDVLATIDRAKYHRDRKIVGSKAIEEYICS